jgi:hypothetical protein
VVKHAVTVENSLAIPPKLNLESSYDPGIPLTVIYAKQVKADNHTSMFLPALFSVVKGGNNPSVCQMIRT